MVVKYDPKIINTENSNDHTVFSIVAKVIQLI